MEPTENISLDIVYFDNRSASVGRWVQAPCNVLVISARTH
jgi:hypothetical protein